MNSRKKVLWKIFISTLYLSAFTFGGGYVIVSLMKKKFVDELHWIEEKEMLGSGCDRTVFTRAIAINGSIVVGYKLAGITGVLVSIIGTIIPPFVIISLLSVCYNTFRSNELVSQIVGRHAGGSRSGDCIGDV
ncbi:MAG: chromate transporter [[Clostridium] symbiosum]